MRFKIVIAGAGGHARVVCDAILAKGEYELVGFIDANVEIGAIVFEDYKVIGNQTNLSGLKSFADHFIVAIGNNSIRKQLFNELKNYLRPAIIIHPSAVIAKNVRLKDGSVCLANAVVSSNSIIGENVILNSGTVIDHDCNIGNHVHLSIGTMVGSNSTIADEITTAIGENINSFSVVDRKI